MLPDTSIATRRPPGSEGSPRGADSAVGTRPGPLAAPPLADGLLAEGWEASPQLAESKVTTPKKSAGIDLVERNTISFLRI